MNAIAVARSLFYVSILYVLVACGNPLTPTDNSLLTGNPCAAPCWNSLVPGTTTAQETLDFLHQLPASEARTLTTYQDNYGRISYKWRGGRNAVYRSAQVERGELSLIALAPDFDLRLGDVTDRLGAPEYVKGELGIGPDIAVYALEVYYTQQGLALVLEPDLQDAGTIRREMRVKTIYYFAPDDLKSFFITRFSLGEREEELAKTVEKSYLPKLQPWPGYGPVKLN
jgi:hypothetical protein